MKLYPLLFIDEAAKTAGSAFDKRLVAINLSEERKFLKQIILISPFAFNRIIKKLAKNYGSLESTEASNVGYSVAEKAAKQAVIANITYLLTSTDECLAEVATSAAVGGYGPFVYQMIMFLHKDLWLASDSSLKPASKRVWNKMYELSNTGMYQRKFLGEFSKDHLLDRTRIDSEILGKYRIEVEAAYKKRKENPTEENLLKFLKRNGLKPEDFGYLWAYKKVEHDPKIEALLFNGNEFLKYVQETYNIPIKEFKEMLRSSGSKMFDRLLGSQASYTE